MRLLVVDDDEEIRELEKMLLQAYFDEVIEASNGEEAILKAKEADFIIIDWMMPKMNGVEAVKFIREETLVPILFVTARGQEYDKIVGYGSGADDYIVKPFSPQELQLKVQAIKRRYTEFGTKASATLTENESQNVNVNVISIRGLQLDSSSHRVYLRGEEISLTAKEFEILNLFMAHPGRVFSAEQIYEFIWEEDYFYTSNATIMTHIKKLRQKIEADSRNPEYILTVWGVGYKIER